MININTACWIKKQHHSYNRSMMAKNSASFYKTQQDDK